MRGLTEWPSWHCVFDWEDEIAEELDLEINKLDDISKLQRFVFNSKTMRLITPIMKKMLLRSEMRIGITFLMSVQLLKYVICDHSRIIPIFIDTPTSSFALLRKLGQAFSQYYVSSFETYEVLRREQNNVSFVPFSIPESWKLSEVPNKTVDVIQAGRKNPLLHKWMLKAAAEMNIEYVYQRNENGILSYWSTKRGRIGDFMDRKKYLHLLGSSKISLVSSGGIDNSRKGYDINPVTVRFLESTVSYCYMIGRFPSESQDFKYTGMSEIVANVENENEFRNHLVRFLGRSFDLKDKYDSLIMRNSTRVIAQTLKNDLQRRFPNSFVEG